MLSVYCPSCKKNDTISNPAIIKLLYIFKSEPKPYYCDELQCNIFNSQSIVKKLNKNIYNYENKIDFMFSKCYRTSSRYYYNHNHLSLPKIEYNNPNSFLEHAIKKANYLVNVKKYPKFKFRHAVALYLNSVNDEIDYVNVYDQPICKFTHIYDQSHIIKWIETNIRQVLECINSLNLCTDVNGIIVAYL